jgi:hypothetical protein
MRKLITITLVLLLSVSSAFAQGTSCEDGLMPMVSAQAAKAICSPKGTLSGEDLTSSDDITAGDDLVVTDDTTLTDDVSVGGQVALDAGTIAAAGTDDTNGTAIVDQIEYVTGADGTVGVELPSGTVGEFYCVINTDATNLLKVYPPASGTINGGTATTGSVSIAGTERACFYKVAANTWWAEGTNRRLPGTLVTAGAITSASGAITATSGNIVATSGNIVATSGDIVATAGDITVTNGALNIPATKNLALIAENAGNATCDATCTQGCVIGFDAGTSSFVACDTNTADTCICAAAGS